MHSLADSGVGFVFGKQKSASTAVPRRIIKPNKSPTQPTSPKLSSADGKFTMTAQILERFISAFLLVQRYQNSANTPADVQAAPASPSKSHSQLSTQQVSPEASAQIAELNAENAKLEAVLAQHSDIAQQQAIASAEQLKSLQADLFTGKKIQTALTKELRLLQRAKAQAQPRISDLESQVM